MSKGSSSIQNNENSLDDGQKCTTSRTFDINFGTIKDTFNIKQAVMENLLHMPFNKSYKVQPTICIIFLVISESIILYIPSGGNGCYGHTMLCLESKYAVKRGYITKQEYEKHIDQLL